MHTLSLDKIERVEKRERERKQDLKKTEAKITFR